MVAGMLRETMTEDERNHALTNVEQHLVGHEAEFCEGMKPAVDDIENRVRHHRFESDR
jgi:hypothetical protein